ncbi:hypothetical protein RF11_04258 [Thelohanellus kitauei]|uniref:Uncharacterized protein n=1 Tax=Thelohanellus kitauei TaxID=669202 RepID=A0A0C2I959_THEKT|nr:hypothetical protein RF11_04258 [Thelohanellus kitauei]
MDCIKNEDRKHTLLITLPLEYDDFVKNMEARFLPVDVQRLRSAQLLEHDPAFIISIFTNGLDDESLKSLIETNDVQTHISRHWVCAANMNTYGLSIVERNLDELATQMANRRIADFPTGDSIVISLLPTNTEDRQITEGIPQRSVKNRWGG